MHDPKLYADLIDLKRFINVNFMITEVIIKEIHGNDIKFDKIKQCE